MENKRTNKTAQDWIPLGLPTSEIVTRLNPEHTYPLREIELTEADAIVIVVILRLHTLMMLSAPNSPLQ